MRRMFRFGRWPRVPNRFGVIERGDIKELSTEDLYRLVEAASRNKWSGRGRPDWLADHRAELTDIYLTFLLEETKGVFRCSTTVVLRDGTGGHFSLDVTRADFDRLPDVKRAGLVDLAHRFLSIFPNIPLDAAQREAWDRAYPRNPA
ncbi:hypothetical protein GT755_03030 [Herbidospora sp. NEAU-GS84]|uniref:Uncharacterized protein n=1 Tax=Herbidospora solisilvae TaxID=2696284 RepID=A0A7C9NKE6_9ACTN|nr:hypothetical protein [Herbidospora solisilvae]NAS20656.1 hypothetical protein [Herbidospora solisilvae]